MGTRCEIPWGDLAEAPDDSLGDRQSRRRGIDREGVEQRAVDLIERVLALVADPVVPAGCIASGKLRPDRRDASYYLWRVVGGLPPREIASRFGTTPKRVRDCLPRGRRVVQRLGADEAVLALIRQDRSTR